MNEINNETAHGFFSTSSRTRLYWRGTRCDLWARVLSSSRSFSAFEHKMCAIFLLLACIHLLLWYCKTKRIASTVLVCCTGKIKWIRHSYSQTNDTQGYNILLSIKHCLLVVCHIRSALRCMIDEIECVLNHHTALCIGRTTEMRWKWKIKGFVIWAYTIDWHYNH